MKNKINRKAVLVSMSLVFVMVIVAITSFANAGIDPSYWGSTKFMTDTIFTVSLVLIGVVSGDAEGDNFYRNKDNGLFQNSYNNYNKKRSIIDNIVDKFSDWAYNLYQKETYKKIMRYLKDDFGIKQADLLIQLDRTEIIQLKNEPKSFNLNGEVRYFNSLTETQIQAIFDVLDGKIKVKFVHDSYFLNAYAKNCNKSMYEQASEQEKRKKQKFAFLMVYRVIFTVLVAMVFTAFVVESSEEGSKAQAVLNLFSRYFTLFTSVGWGFFIASDMIKDECVFLDYKAMILNQFYLDVEVNKTFVVKSEEEKAFEKIQKIMEEGAMNGAGTS